MNEYESFDDPVLKNALRRNFGDQVAPADLRQRVADLMRAEGNSIEQTFRLSGPTISRWYAVAAVVLMALGVGLYMVSLSPNNTQLAGMPVTASVLPVSLSSEIVKTHGQSISQSDPLLSTAQTDIKQNCVELSEKLQRTVLVADIEQDGWRFVGASMCDINQTKAARLTFRRPNQTLSIFTVPAKACSDDPEDSTYACENKGHPIAGFIKNGSLHCVVGNSTDGSLTLKDVVAIRDVLRVAAIGNGACTGEKSTPQ